MSDDFLDGPKPSHPTVDIDNLRLFYVKTRSEEISGWMKGQDTEALRHKFIPAIESSFFAFALQDAIINIATKEFDGHIKPITKENAQAAIISEISLTLPAQTLEPFAQERLSEAGLNIPKGSQAIN